VAGRIRSVEKIHLIGTRTCDLLACSIHSASTYYATEEAETKKNESHIAKVIYKRYLRKM
jgi:hypothetical protein